MLTLFELFGFILLVIETLIGMVGNGFIAIVNCIDWHRSRKLSPADMILSCLSLFRFAFHAVTLQIAIFKLFFVDPFLMLKLNIAYDFSWLFLNTTSLWFAAWLSVLYCVKIANFSHPHFLQMKRRFPGLVPWLLLGTVVFSAITTTVAITGSIIVSKCNPFESHLNNSSDSGINTTNSFLSRMGINDNGVHFIFLNVIAAYSSGHALILIFISPKLKQESVRMLHQLRC
uniref:taste receptor type 2 member 41-like n=1 Tax=Podarcis muralis TaxID=64176 RepID=UPI0010A0509D|nr:taste receptor type 2 member 41-like [Podarcis muralis]